MTSMPEMVALFKRFGWRRQSAGWLVNALHGGCWHLHRRDRFAGHPHWWPELSPAASLPGASSAKPSTVPPLVFTGQRIVNALILIGILAAGYMVCHSPGAGFPMALCDARPCAAAGRDGGHPHWRGRHAGGHIPAQQLLRHSRLCCGLCHQQQHTDSGGLAGGRPRASFSPTSCARP